MSRTITLGYREDDAEAHYLPALRCSLHGTLRPPSPRGAQLTDATICCPEAAALWAMLDSGILLLESTPWGPTSCDVANPTVRGLLECGQLWQYQSASPSEREGHFLIS